MAETILVHIIPRVEQKIYEPRYLSITPGHVIGCENSRNLGFLLGYCSKEEYEKRVVPIREAMDRYNSIVRTLWNISGFKEYFAENNSVVSKDAIAKRFGDEIADLALSLESPPHCYPDLTVFGNMFQLSNAGYQGEFTFKNQKYSFGIDGNAESYPNEISNKICFWNWDNNSTDYSLDFAHFVEERLPKGLIATGSLYDFDYYDQWRGTDIPIVIVINEIFSSMEQRGYLTKYLLKAENYESVWKYYTGMSSGTVGLYLCDPKAFKDPLFVDRVNALLQACSIAYDDDNNPHYGSLIDEHTEQLNPNQPHYYLQDEHNKTYISKAPGSLGGHYKLGIYGRLDCPSANRYVAKGQYVRHRVFFKDENTAIAAGYRPCGVCMKEAYRRWKENPDAFQHQNVKDDII